ncbi:MAG: TetR/AcrR family transcriptional regulator [Lactobacillaceae bacterium]|jgi:AcrR family transcriptional regulator|nr:TetR/AcrR family transcriptional regulator [Lactobacillaceae bacterium]
MAKRDLTREKIMLAAIDLAKELGVDYVTFPRLAEHFNIKAPSLYNHFSNIHEVRVEAVVYVAKDLFASSKESMANKSPKKALAAFALTYQEIARKYHYIYVLIDIVPLETREILLEITQAVSDLIDEQLETFDLTAEEVLQYNRMFFSIVRGYTTLNNNGNFNAPNSPTDDSYTWMIDHFLDQLPEK